uniref:Uncharacterized protein n=1 Tax=Cryptomonas curvata TaxID=233186 RepID=A0A7S0MJ14_9CRYP|mmetsp:Transcript_43911/g.91935  ORF Transcript_43911/g.91935 Transcript_43911/m.91935 type:complete len:259 (+) Transcript_43911:599-1375(+)|eukprot:CAMPEP_0172192724 /NCGR_PEP_ID=MMETSP1050-20130122/24508_1 /TAXON_ID=233186 /ORGANISM="Cryptomonas curvata, Strain CCAP979/52" /LENGTH=258 /DNA_ID=CAMNT_0012868101 /DNA_START=588 /DNA_END=1364 /DNA_ORIENTATION=-
MFSGGYLTLAGESLRVKFCSLHARGGSSGEAILLIAEHLRSMQDRRGQPVGLHEDADLSRFYHGEEGFSEIVGGLVMVGTFGNMTALFNTVFPVDPDCPRYTQEQLVCLARVLLDSVERIAVDSENGLGNNTTTTTAVVERTLASEPVVARVVHTMLTEAAVEKADEIVQLDPSDDRMAIIRKASELCDTLDAYMTVKKQAVSTSSMQLDSMLDTTACLDNDYKLAEALALSQAVANDEEAQFERDMQRAMAESMREC